MEMDDVYQVASGVTVTLIVPPALMKRDAPVDHLACLNAAIKNAYRNQKHVMVKTIASTVKMNLIAIEEEEHQRNVLDLSSGVTIKKNVLIDQMLARPTVLETFVHVKQQIFRYAAERGHFRQF